VPYRKPTINVLVYVGETKNMDDKLKILNNIRILRAQSKKYELKKLEEMLKKLESIVNERRKEENLYNEKKKEKTKKLQYYREMIISDGVDPNELLKIMVPKKLSKKFKSILKPAKYKYINKNGITKTWTGKGRIPADIKKEIKVKKN